MARLEQLATLIGIGIPSYMIENTDQLSFWVYHGGYWHDVALFNNSDITVSTFENQITISKNIDYFEFSNLGNTQVTLTAIAFSLGIARVGNELIDNFPVNIVLGPNQKVRLTSVKITIV